MIEDSIRRQIVAVGGRVDGKTTKQIVLSIPISAGFPAVKRALDAAVAVDSTAEWYYGNVYDPVDGVTPLDWCK